MIVFCRRWALPLRPRQWRVCAAVGEAGEAGREDGGMGGRAAGREATSWLGDRRLEKLTYSDSWGGYVALRSDSECVPQGFPADQQLLAAPVSFSQLLTSRAGRRYKGESCTCSVGL